MKFVFAFAIGFLAKVIISTEIPINVNIYCSDEFHFVNRLNRLCRWLYDNGTSYADTYQSALLDCPVDYMLASFKNITGAKFTFNCVEPKKIWMNVNSLSNHNVLNVHTNGQVNASIESLQTSLEYFMCINKTQKVTCEPDEYLVNDTLICLDALGFDQTCLFNDMCNQKLSLVCNMTIGKCECPSSFFWNGTSCSHKKTLNELCSGPYGTNMCADFLGLSCLSGICSCNSTTQLWNGTACQFIKTCRDVKAYKPSSPSTIYYIQGSSDLIEVYCEMNIDGGGYTFIPQSSLSKIDSSVLNSIYTDKTRILFRIMSRTNYQVQKYIVSSQLDIHNNIPIGVTLDTLSPGVIFSFVQNVVNGTTNGLKGNAASISFTNCDSNPSSFIRLLVNPLSALFNFQGVSGSWLNSSISHSNFLPLEYFYFTEFAFGGCGDYSHSPLWDIYNGTAFGLK